MKKTLPLAVVCVALGLAVSACGSGQDGPGDKPAAVTKQNGDGGAAGGGPGGGGPGGSGMVAAVSGSTAQVQGPEGQVAVSWNARTTFTRQVSAAAEDLKVGDCVMAMPSSPSSDDTSTVAAATVRISKAVGGSCTNGFVDQRGGGPGDGPRTDQQSPPEGAPSGAPSDGVRRGGFGAVGKVTAISGTGFTVESVRPGSEETSSITVTTTGTTTWLTSAKANSKDVKVGHCVTSVGRPDSTGAITATSIAVSQPVNGQCAVMFGGPGTDRPGGETQNS
ncbi:DUF5666 domain-containing protein [Marmoricola sp. URHB0036]|uniref:DUF5666 domain-containing protein n=1 Tax=Marmoricola sp. URHB0036 TaxID=1298863 RepID=UPI000412E9F7|nr:DUF5666 domain-containing protein [Marmoricola sp. URHB0036]